MPLNQMKYMFSIMFDKIPKSLTNTKRAARSCCLNLANTIAEIASKATIIAK